MTVRKLAQEECSVVNVFDGPDNEFIGLLIEWKNFSYFYSVEDIGYDEDVHSHLLDCLNEEIKSFYNRIKEGSIEDVLKLEIQE